MSQPLVSIRDARAQVLAVARGRLGEEVVDIELAAGRILAQDVRASGDVPRFPVSAMDGYAVPDSGPPATFRVVGESRAGVPFSGRLRHGEAIRISTGATVPPEAAAVIRQEDVEVSGAQTIETRVAVSPSANVRAAGEDMRSGQLIVAAGTRLRAGELGAAVAAGAGRLTLARRPAVAIVCTGDELRAPGEPLGPGEIHNSNAPMLRALSASCGALALPATRLVDDLDATEAALSERLNACDVLIVSGGVSVGPHDHVKPALQRLGVRQHFWGVALQPGKPTWFGSRGRQLVFALPGNPVSAAVTFSLFARPALFALQGAVAPPHAVATAVLGVAVARNPTRDQAVRVTLNPSDGAVLAAPTGAQDSHLFSSLLAADALAIIPRGDGELPAGSPVNLEPLPA